MWRKKEKYHELDTRSLIVNKENKEFRGFGWGILYLIMFGTAALYDERLGYMMMGSLLTIIIMSIYNAHKKRY